MRKREREELEARGSVRGTCNTQGVALGNVCRHTCWCSGADWLQGPVVIGVVCPSSTTPAQALVKEDTPKWDMMIQLQSKRGKRRCSLLKLPLRQGDWLTMLAS